MEGRGLIPAGTRPRAAPSYALILSQHVFKVVAARALLDAAFRHMDLHRVWAACDPRNRASYRVMEKLGMRRETHFRKDVLEKGEWRDSYLYAILAEEWSANPDAASL